VISDLKVSHSGIRGIVGESLTEETVFKFTWAFAQLAKRHSESPLLVLGRDTRPSGPELRQAVLSALSLSGCRVTDLETVPTSTVLVMASNLGADGAVIITASHNPPEWNGLKFYLGPPHIALDSDQIRLLTGLFQTRTQQMPNAAPPEPARAREEAMKVHLARCLDLVDAEKIRARRFRVAFDSGRGAGEEVGIRLLEKLGCEVLSVEVERPSEPVPENLAALCWHVADNDCDLGMALDLDGDRLALVSEKEQAVGEDYTFPLVLQRLLQRWKEEDHTGRPLVAKSAETTSMIDSLALAAGAELVECAVGEVNLSKCVWEACQERRRAIGGENTGGVIIPSVCFCRDGMASAAMLLEHAANSGASLSRLIASLPHRHIIKLNIPHMGSEEANSFIRALERRFAAQKQSRLDGLKVLFDDGSWFIVRPSNTEPLVRLVVDADDEARAASLADQVLALA
jgi:phosphomannomutase